VTWAGHVLELVAEAGVSATNRAAVRDELDRYDTPAWCVHRLLERVQLPAGPWLEPACGDGAIYRAVTERYLNADSWTLLDVAPRGEMAGRAIAADFLAWKPRNGRQRFRVAITNPPYRHAMAFASYALDLADVVVMLLRLPWLASEARAPWLQRHTPDVFILPNRPSFTGRGTDATDYAWMVWGLNYAGQPGRIQVLDTTPVSVRRGRVA
jgi:hypothetical protein